MSEYQTGYAFAQTFVSFEGFAPAQAFGATLPRLNMFAVGFRSCINSMVERQSQ